MSLLTKRQTRPDHGRCHCLSPTPVPQPGSTRVSLFCAREGSLGSLHIYLLGPCQRIALWGPCYHRPLRIFDGRNLQSNFDCKQKRNSSSLRHPRKRGRGATSLSPTFRKMQRVLDFSFRTGIFTLLQMLCSLCDCVTFSDSAYYSPDGTLQVTVEGRLTKPVTDAGCVIC